MGTNKPSCGRKNRNTNFHKNIPSVEDLLVNAKEHKLLKKFRRRLEKRHNVQICMPKTKSLDSDVIFISIQGEKSERDNVKKFLTEKMNSSTLVQSHNEDNVTLITLSDSESESSDTENESSDTENESSDSENESSDSKNESSEDVSLIDLASEDTPQKEKKITNRESHDDSVCIIELPPPTTSTITNIKFMNSSGCQHLKKAKRKWSKTKNMQVSKKAKLSESVVIEEPTTSSKPAVDYIPLLSGNKSVNQKNEHTNQNFKSKNSDTDIIIIDEPESTVVSRCLRPIVIDGSNVAMEHGKVSHSFSVKGLKLAIDYFLNRGHKQVTAFVPKFRKSKNPNRSVPTTDGDIFDELEKKQLVVFTPSRRINGRCISSYDDRFIVQLAASNGGIIVSNDNFRDIINDSESFKEAIEERLLMFCFAGDVFMVPNDPLGRNGPSLNDFLSFPPEKEDT